MLTPEGYKSRLVEKQFDEYMQTFGAVCIEGPKYCGKTWTARSRAKSAAFVGNPENNFQTRTMAQISPDLVLKGDLPSPVDLPSGCKFHTRCPYVMEKCRNSVPQEKGCGHRVKCFLYE